MRFIAHPFSKINLEPMCLPRRCGFQNGGVKSYRYESPLLLTSYIYIMVHRSICVI